MDSPKADIKITSLGRSSTINDMRIKKISMLGSEEKLKWKQQDDALMITLPDKLPSWKVLAFKIEFKR
jgi:alpha-L-fucosidase